jgi:hypothetical protein
MKYPSPSDVEKSFSFVYWNYTIANPEKAYMSNCPSLSNYDNMYGDDSSYLWILGQITALFGLSSEKDEHKADGIGIFSKCFAKEVGAFKLSELMLFFARYAAGRYDNSWQTFDTHKIGNAFFKEFLPQRQKEIEIYEARASREKVVREAMERKKTAISYQQWKKMKVTEIVKTEKTNNDE